jgi:UDP-N-acetylmuramate--alanine ligase
MTAFSGRRFHFIGAGGIGMSGLAKLLMKNGAIVTGSDQEDSSVAAELVHLGADIKIGHAAGNLKMPVEAVVMSAAITARNPELAAAGERGCKIYKYAEMLGELMDGYRGIAVCGTHGKSTTSGWLSFVLDRAGLSPSFIVGADIRQLGGSSGVGEGNLFVAEACEYDRSFLNLHPKIGIILNIEQDHLDYYRDEAEIVEAFGDFVSGVREKGVLIANGMDGNVRRVLERLGQGREYKTFGLEGDFDFSARNVELVEGFYKFDVYQKGGLLGRVRISLAGKHNVVNALAVIAAATNAGVEAGKALEFLGRFEGIDRRLMLKAQIDGITILDDYAHHPTEIRASLEAIRDRFSPRRLLCVFQPHQYSRTRFLLDDFSESFKFADITIVPEIYFVRDTAAARSRVNAQVLVERICGQGCRAVFINDFDGIVEYLKENVKSGDLVVTMGAGDIWKVADGYIQWFRTDR